MSLTTMLGGHRCVYVRTDVAIRRFGPHATDSRITERCQMATFQRGDTR